LRSKLASSSLGLPAIFTTKLKMINKIPLVKEIKACSIKRKNYITEKSTALKKWEIQNFWPNYLKL